MCIWTSLSEMMVNLTMKWALRTLCLIMVVSCVTGLHFSALIMWRLFILVREAVEDELEVERFIKCLMQHQCHHFTVRVRGHMGPTGALGRLYLSVHCCSKLQNQNAMWWRYYGFKTRKLTLGEWKWFQTVCDDFQRSDFIIIRKHWCF